MQFLADVELVCEECKGTRFKSSILDIRYHGLNIHEVLQLTVKEALSFFSESTAPGDQAQGAGRCRAGLSAAGPIGDDAQRRRSAARETGRASLPGELRRALCTSSTSRPPACTSTTSRSCWRAFQRLIENGGSILIIEHNLDVIRSADWVIDLGPEGGERGGEIVAEGTPEQIAAARNSYTGRYLKKYAANAAG